MSSYQIIESATINAPAERVYEILADYENGHPHILPKPAFVGLEVLEGGYGAGTRFRLEMQAFGRRTSSEAVVTEPEPGRVLVETIEKDGIVTTFIVEPTADGQRTETTFQTEIRSPKGLMAPITKLMTRLYLRRVLSGRAGDARPVCPAADDGPAYIVSQDVSQDRHTGSTNPLLPLRRTRPPHRF